MLNVALVVLQNGCLPEEALQTMTEIVQVTIQKSGKVCIDLIFHSLKRYGGIRMFCIAPIYFFPEV